MTWEVLQSHLRESAASHLELMRVEMTQHVATREEVDWCASDTKEAIAQQLSGVKRELEASVESAKQEIDSLRQQQETAGQRIGKLERKVETQEHVLAAVQHVALAGMGCGGRDDRDEGFVDDDEWWMWCGP